MTGTRLGPEAGTGRTAPAPRGNGAAPSRTTSPARPTCPRRSAGRPRWRWSSTRRIHPRHRTGHRVFPGGSESGSPRPRDDPWRRTRPYPHRGTGPRRNGGSRPLWTPPSAPLQGDGGKQTEISSPTSPAPTSPAPTGWGPTRCSRTRNRTQRSCAPSLLHDFRPEVRKTPERRQDPVTLREGSEPQR